MNRILVGGAGGAPTEAKLTICVAGRLNIAVRVLEYLYKNNKGRYNLCAVCCISDDGFNHNQRSLRLYANTIGIKEVALDDVYDIENLLFLSLEFDRIINPEKFKSTRLFNVHFSLLPKYKGCYPSVWPILNGEECSGVTLHRIGKGIDTGEIVAQKSFGICGLDCRELHKKYIEEGTSLVIQNIDTLIYKDEKLVPQSSMNSTYYSRKTIDYSNLIIDLRQTACCIQRQIKAFSYRGFQLPSVAGHEIIDCIVTNQPSDKPPGEVLYEDDSSLTLSAIDYNIVLFKDRFAELLDACALGNLSGIQEICAVKKHINDCDSEHGWTPLMVAANHNQKSVVKWLISQGADVTAVDNNGSNLLFYAKDAYEKTGDSSLFKLFLDEGLSVDQCDYLNVSVRKCLGECMDSHLQNILCDMEKGGYAWVYGQSEP